MPSMRAVALSHNPAEDSELWERSWQQTPQDRIHSTLRSRFDREHNLVYTLVYRIRHTGYEIQPVAFEERTMMTDNRHSFLVHPDLADGAKLQHTLLREKAIERLRNYIVGGQFPPGTKLVEREVADLLGVSRAPVRDALMELEKEGLVDTRSTGRYVIELTVSDIRDLYQVRHVLERLAVTLAAQNICAQNRSALDQCLQALEQATAQHDREQYVAADVETHWSIWRQSGNKHLFRMLSSMVGPIFMFVAHNAGDLDWKETLMQHQALIHAIQSGDVDEALDHLDVHMADALEHSVQSWKRRDIR